MDGGSHDVEQAFCLGHDFSTAVSNLRVIRTVESGGLAVLCLQLHDFDVNRSFGWYLSLPCDIQCPFDCDVMISCSRQLLIELLLNIFRVLGDLLLALVVSIFV